MKDGKYALPYMVLYEHHYHFINNGVKLSGHTQKQVSVKDFPEVKID